MIRKLFVFLFVSTILLCNDTNEFKVGDFVWSQEYGWGLVVHTNYNKSYPVKVRFKAKDMTYTIDGRRLDYINRSLFFQEITITEDCLKRNGDKTNKPK